jgi:hypothetical protein
MRVTDHRYSRDRMRLDLALRFIRLEARTQTIRSWTGLTDDRIRKLYRTYLETADGLVVPRHRGKSPQQAAFFTRTPRLRQDASAFAALLALFGVLPQHGATAVIQHIPGVGRGSLLCRAYELHRRLMPATQISFEHAVFLLTALARGDEVMLVRCNACGAVGVRDRLTVRGQQCGCCDQELPAQPFPVHAMPTPA